MKQNLILIATVGVAITLPAGAQDAADPFAAGEARRPTTTDSAIPSAAGGADPFSGGGAPAANRQFIEPPTELRSDLGIRYEVFSLDLASAANLMRSDPADADLYKTLVAMVGTEKAQQETLTMVRTRSGQRSKVEMIFEYIYPTEWDPAEIPNSIGVKIDPPPGSNGKPTTGNPNVEALDKAQTLEDLPAFSTPANPTAFETRNLGFTLEIDAVTNSDGSMIEAMVAPEHVTLAGTTPWGKGLSQVETPEFESQKLSTSVILVPGLPRLLGTMNRPPVSNIDPDSANRIWLAFMTASHVK